MAVETDVLYVKTAELQKCQICHTACWTEEAYQAEHVSNEYLTLQPKPKDNGSGQCQVGLWGF